MMIKTVYPVRPRAIAGLVIILLLGIWLRAGDGAALTHFRYDQAEMAQMALEMWHGEKIHWLGTPNSAGIPNSPLTIWIYLPVLAFSDSPQVMTLFVTLWNVFGVFLLWWIGHRYFEPMVGFVAGLLFAVSPWAVYLSRAIWEPRTIMPLILLALAVGLYGYIENKRLAQILFYPLLFVALQFHYVALTLLPLIACIWWAGREHIKWTPALIGLGLGIMTFIPFAVGLSQESPGSDGRIEQIVNIWLDGPDLRFYPVMQMVELATGQGMTPLSLPLTANDIAERWPLTPIVQYVTGLLTLAGFGVVWVRRGWRPYAPMLTVWALITLIVLVPAWTGSGVYRHHFAANLPALSLLAALSIVAGISVIVSRVPSAYSAGIRITGLTIVAAVAIIGHGLFVYQMYQIWNMSYTVNVRSGQTATPLHYLMDVREELQPYEDVIILGANPHESNYYIWTPMLYNTAECVRDLLINDGQIDILPDGPYAVLVAPLNPINSNYTVPERYQNDNQTVVPLRPGEDPYIIYAFDEAPAWTETPIQPVDVLPFETGVRLTGYHLMADAVQLRWRIQDAPGDSYQYYVHFLDESGERIGQRDAPFYVGQHWCEGDTLITTVQTTIPPSTEILRVGMYKLDPDGGITNQAVVDDTGNPVMQWVDIPLSSETTDFDNE